MTAYWILCYGEISDPAEVAAYAELAALSHGAVRDLRIVPGLD